MDEPDIVLPIAESPTKKRLQKKTLYLFMHVRHAKLIDVLGRPAAHGGFTFVPADVELEGASFSTSHALADLPRDHIPPVLCRPIEEEYDAAWVRARLPYIFGFTPAPTEAEKSLLYLGFVVPTADTTAIAFVCSDYYGKTSLIFSDSEINDELKACVAQAFWNLLLEEPDNLADFNTEVMHLGAGVALHFGCKQGEPFFYETPQ